MGVTPKYMGQVGQVGVCSICSYLVNLHVKHDASVKNTLYRLAFLAQPRLGEANLGTWVDGSIP